MKRLLKGVSSFALLLLLSSCGSLHRLAETPQRSVARRRAVSTSQRQEARMARPAALGSLPLVDYAPYKQINPGMTLEEIQLMLGDEGEWKDELADGSLQAPEVSEELGERGWRWTHPSGAYNIHVRLTADAKQDTWAVQSKWLTYNPPESDVEPALEQS